MDLTALPLAEQPLLLRAWLSRAVPELDNLVLVLNPDNAISRRIELPRAAEENLRQAIAYELNRYTPFKASDVYFDYRVLKRVLGERGLTVQIAVAPKTRVDPSLGLLAQAGVRPAAVVLGDDLSAERVPLNLLPLERRVKAAPRISAPNTLLAALALILFAAALGFPVWQKRQAIAAFNPLVESAKRDAEDVDRLKQDLDTQVQVYDFLLQRKHTYPAATIVMDELTRVLPDGTWLQQLNLRSHPKGWELQIQGETTISSRLASDIEDSPLFRDASFKSPLIKGQAPGSERFNLSAELEPAPAPKAQRLEDKRPPAHVGAVRTVEQPAADTALQPATPLAPAKP
jgi:general secretion pathway protein L